MVKKSNILFKKIFSILYITFILLTIIFNITGCNVAKFHILQHPNIEQGIYLTKQDIKKVHVGLTKSEVCTNIGSPTLQDLFNSNIWYYIYYRCYPNGQENHQTIMLKFDKNNTLIFIKKL